MKRLICLLTMLLALASVPALAAEPLRWVQYGADGVAEARVVIDGTVCPSLTVDGHNFPMSERAAPDKDFPARLCTAKLPAGSRDIAVLGAALPAPKAAPQRILVLGDTGCRVLDAIVQACNDPVAWPWAQLAAQAAATHPDLVIHVGDYLYRETPCPSGVSGCAGSPWGDNWKTWEADFFAPGERLLTTAPWIMVRGNHEECARAGRGWTRLLDPAPFASDTPCVAHRPPYAVALDRLTLIVADNANASDAPASDSLIPDYRADLATHARLATGPSWLLMHRPLRGLVRLSSGKVVGGNQTLLRAWEPGLPRNIELLIAGHIHTFEAINYEGDLAPQLIVGVGGDKLDGAPEDLAGLDVGGVKVREGLTLSGFGFLVLTRDADGWRGEVYDVSGAMKGRCRNAARRITCEPG